MTVTKIYFEELFPTGPYANQRLGVEVVMEKYDVGYGLSEERAIEKAFKLAKSHIDRAFKSINPEPIAQESQPVPSIDRKKQTLIEIINDSATPEELIAIKDEVGKYGLVDMYADKLDELKNKKL